MIYLYLGKNTIKLISLSKTLLGQYTVATFQKTHETTLLEKGDVKSVDILASAVKEALTTAGTKDTDVYLILPQEAFHFARYDVPPDIQSSAIVPFIKDKARADFPFDLDNTLFDYLLVQHQNESAVLFFALQSEVFTKYKEVLSLLGLTIRATIPETVSYYKLFEKTLKKDKRENIVFLNYEETSASGYLFDSFGLLKETRLTFTDPIEKSLQEKLEKLKKDVGKIDRIVLSGEKSKTVRQDTFTKDVGVWTNPLEKIVLNFYTDYLKLIVPTDKSAFQFLLFDVCLGAFILHRENPQFFVVQKGGVFSKKSARTLPSFSLRLPIRGRDIVIFIVSSILSFSAIALYQNYKNKLPNFSLPSGNKTKEITIKTPSAAPTEKPSPTPAVNREEVNIKILNGSGTVGKAGEVKDILKEKGYIEILTGNADAFDYDTTEMQVKDDKKDAAELLKSDLSDNVKITTTSSLDEEDAADIILIIGSDFE